MVKLYYFAVPISATPPSCTIHIPSVWCVCVYFGGMLKQNIFTTLYDVWVCACAVLYMCLQSLFPSILCTFLIADPEGLCQKFKLMHCSCYWCKHGNEKSANKWNNIMSLKKLWKVVMFDFTLSDGIWLTLSAILVFVLNCFALLAAALQIICYFETKLNWIKCYCRFIHPFFAKKLQKESSTSSRVQSPRN